MADKRKIQTNALLKKGVLIPAPDSVEIGQEVDIDRIATDDVVIHAGSKIYGAGTFIGAHARIGVEAPATIINCRIGPGVQLKGGYFENAVFLEGAEAGSGAHVRGGTILEEQASIAHTVGLKQTILFPFVTLGSLINFCDCFMAGGTSPKNHSEVGSSYIHFNYTPNQDKATPSLIGDVPHGVMLNQNPIFLGGQGGLVGPCRIAYGTVIAAGFVYRKDQLKPDRLVFEGMGRGGSLSYTTGMYKSVKRQALNNIIYIANLVALMAWYTHIRRLFIGQRFPQALYDGLIDTLHLAIRERIQRFGHFCKKLDASKRLYQRQMGTMATDKLVTQKEQLVSRHHQIAGLIGSYLENSHNHSPTAFKTIILRKMDGAGSAYIDVIKSLDATAVGLGVDWLQLIVDEVTETMMDLFPAIR